MDLLLQSYKKKIKKRRAQVVESAPIALDDGGL
jgi:hypothetical protein